MKITRLITASVVAVLAVPAFAQVFHGSARVIPPDGTRANEVFLFDAAGTMTGQYNQIAAAAADAWGYRDGASDGTSVYFGWGGGLARHDADGANGTLMFANGTGNSTIRALAFDPTGNGGAGSFWTADFGSSLVEVDMAGNVLNSFANGAGWSLYGLAFDDSDGNLFGHNTGGEIVKIDTSSGFMTSVFATGFTTLAAQGGLSGMSELGGNLAAVSQGTPDEFGIYDMGAANGSFASGPFDMETQSGSPGHLGIAVVNPVPEPASMIALGLGAAALLRRRRKNA